MSIVALKRNSRRFQAPISGHGKDGFSLVGGRRNIGAVGQTNLAKSTTRTREKFIHASSKSNPNGGKVEPQGWGGCCNTYVKTIYNSGSCCTNDPNIIKPTVKNTAGMLAGHCSGGPYNTKNIKCNRTQFPNNIVQPMGAYGGNTQSTHIKNKSTNSSHCNSFQCDAGKKCCKPTPESSNPGTYFIGGRKIAPRRYFKNTNTVPSGEYTKTLYMKKNKLPLSAADSHFPSSLNHKGKTGSCDVNYTSLEEAIAAGWPWKNNSTVSYASSGDPANPNSVCTKKKCGLNFRCC
jgi:hypothetical protein